MPADYYQFSKFYRFNVALIKAFFGLFACWGISCFCCMAADDGDERRSVESDLCDPMNCSPLGSFVHGIFQVKNTGVFALSFSRGSS